MQLSAGQVFAGYMIVRPLGSGGMGEVYLADHPRLPRQNALKVLPADVSADADYRARFIREADLASKLWHPHIVAVHDRGEFNGQLWISMDYVDGLDGAQLLANRYPDGMPVEQVVRIVIAVASALDYAHKQGLLHRDVKPANIMLTHPDGDDDDQRVLLADFGIARNVDDISGLTATNMAVGTVAYAAPEQLMGENLDGRADQYALAATVYHLLTGRQPYPHSNPAVVISRHLNAAPPKLSDIRDSLVKFDPPLATALSKKPDDRYARSSDFARALVEQNTSPVAAVLAAAPTQPAPVAPRAAAEAGDNQSRAETVSASGRALHKRLILAVAATALAAIVVAVVALRPWVEQTSAAGLEATHDTSLAQPTRNTGPLTGYYTADYGPEIELGSSKGLNPDAAQGILEIRSACTPTGCVAVAKAKTGPNINRTLIFDDIGGQWLSVGTALSTSPAISKGMKAGCEQGLAPEVWETVSLQPRQNGTFTGQYEVTDANNCNTSRTVNLTRTGDVDIASIGDAAALPPRKPSPAAGFRGQYRYTHSAAAGSHDVLGFVQTRCLRTGERCMSYFYESRSAEPFVFADGQWILHYNAPVSCGSATGPRVRIDRSAELDLPQPTSDPIEVLAGQGQETVSSGPCAGTQNFNLRFERTGD
ncbi:serine/threonine-protein kinase [Mycobacterium sp. 1465703.0]|uniref:serine/threonine-protein kinase n=1 Tax=Mycobacterium sp. 1465703.0 TaxID=1834078 RepID=UPI0009F6E48A|nr:serine/threonine-protein kinase [Mycobacterium sp. 1465703.0]